MKSKLYIFFTLLLVGLFYLTCTHDNEVATAPPIIRGGQIMLPGTLAAGDTTQWKFDKAHSGVLWQSAYVGAAGWLTGRFDQFGLHDVTDAKSIDYAVTTQPLPDTSWAFYENDPAKSYFNGYVQVNTFDTGEPGRDTGCIIATLGTAKILTGVQSLKLTNLAKIKTKVIKFDPESSDYLVTMDFTWQGKLAAPKTVTLEGKLKYVPRARVQFGTSAAYSVFGLNLTFELNCRDFGVTSTSVNDIIQVSCNANFNNK